MSPLHGEGRRFEPVTRYQLIGIKMKNLISENGGYKVYAEVNQFSNSHQDVELKFVTSYDSAKNPEEEQVKFKMILTPEQRRVLKELL